eukprot:m.47281 g.47281  ORF g.47281 m.47281 type:complete len:423 (-) comp10477_c0_seq1:565-1833(-)
MKMATRCIVVVGPVMLLLLSAKTAESLSTNIGFKKGVAGGGLCGDLDEGGLNTTTWWYDWGHTKEGFKQCNGTSPKTQEYVPMIWGKWTLKNVTALIETLKANASGARYIFGFNEPDHSGSYLNPEDGASRWPAMEQVAAQLNLTLISPCVSNYESGEWWLHQFSEAFKNSTGRLPRMDMMCVHIYTSSVTGANSTINSIYRDYRRPVWVNEFACPPYKGCTAPNQLSFMKSILPVFEASPYVFRYSWFVNRDNRPPPKGDDSLHVVNSTLLTTLGQYYNNYVPARPPPPPVPPAPIPPPLPPSPSPSPSPSPPSPPPSPSPPSPSPPSPSPPSPPSPPPPPSPSPNCSVAGRVNLNSTKMKYCYEICDNKCYQKECEHYYTVIDGRDIPCLYSMPSSTKPKGGDLILIRVLLTYIVENRFM